MKRHNNLSVKHHNRRRAQLFFVLLVASLIGSAYVFASLATPREALSQQLYKVWVEGLDLRGFAWGSDVVGWISFNSKDVSVPTADYKVRFGGLEVTLVATPHRGRIPLRDVDLTADVINSFGGNMRYSFDCGNGFQAPTSGMTTETTYTAKDACDYSKVDTFTATVSVENFDTGEVANASVDIDVFGFGEINPQ